MFLSKKILLPLVTYLVFVMLIIGGMSTSSYAGFVSAESFETVINSTADIEKIEAVLDKKIIAQRLEDLGLAPEKIKEKLSQLSATQLQKIASRIDVVYTGSGDGLSFVISMLLIVLLTVLILQSTGHNVIVTKG